MPLRPPAGFIRPGYDPLKVPNAPTGVSATAGDASASVSFTAPANPGGSAITAYYAVSNPSQITVSGTTSPISVTGLSNGTAYTFNVWALNSYGPGVWSAASGSVTPTAPIGVFGGGNGYINTIQYITIATTGNSQSFGQLTQGRVALGACASNTYGVFGGGASTGGAAGAVNRIDYVTFASVGNAASFGQLTQQRQAVAGLSNATRGVFGGGVNTTGNPVQTMDYITIASPGNATSFGTIAAAVYYLGACASSTRGIFAGGSTASIYYITIGTTGNTTSFGSLTPGTTRGSAGCSNSTTGVFAAGVVSSVNSSNIQYITIASTGNSASFGNLSLSTNYMGAVANSTRAVFAGGTTDGSIMEYITLASTGNSTTFGTLTTSTNQLAGCSNGHGGLQ